MKTLKMIVLTSLVMVLVWVVSCTQINSGLKEINSSMESFREKHDAGPSEPVIDHLPLVYYKYLPNPKKGGACNPTFVEKLDEETMVKIAKISVTAPLDKRTGGYQDYPEDKLKFHMRMDGCAMGADGFTETVFTEHEAKGIAWAFKKNLR